MKNILKKIGLKDHSDKMIWLQRISKNAFSNLKRAQLLTIATTLIITLIFFIFNVMLAVHFASDSIVEQIGKKIDIRAEIQEETERYSVETLVGSLQVLPGVSRVKYTDKEEALQQFGEKYPHVISFLNNNQLKNPLPSTLRISTKNIAYNDEVLAFLEKPEYSRIVNQEKLTNDTGQKDRQQKALNITLFIQKVGWWLNLIFAIVCLLIIFNSINLNIHTHRHEINIMKLVGAHLNFIRGGYVLQGLFYAIAGLILSLLLIDLTLVYVSKNLLEVISNENLLVGLDSVLLRYEDQFMLTFLWQLLGALFIGISSSLLAIELYLKKKIHF